MSSEVKQIIEMYYKYKGLLMLKKDEFASSVKTLASKETRFLNINDMSIMAQTSKLAMAEAIRITAKMENCNIILKDIFKINVDDYVVVNFKNSSKVMSVMELREVYYVEFKDKVTRIDHEIGMLSVYYDCGDTEIKILDM